MKCHAKFTALCTVGQSGSGLTYCGYDIADLADNSTFEEVAYLLFNGELPNEKELATYKTDLFAMRDLPQALKAVLKLIPADAHPPRPRLNFMQNWPHPIKIKMFPNTIR